jgi:FtsH-binding integral membrane protein
MTGANGPKQDNEDQMSFVRKVLGIVAGQLTITFIMLIGASVTPTENANCRFINVGYLEKPLCLNSFGYFSTSLACQLTSFFVYLFSIIALLCSKNLRHSVPINYIVLTIFTISMGFIFSGLTAWLTATSVLLSIGVLVVTLLCLFGAALLIPAKAAVMKGILIGVLAALFL